VNPLVVIAVIGGMAVVITKAIEARTPRFVRLPVPVDPPDSALGEALSPEEYARGLDLWVAQNEALIGEAADFVRQSGLEAAPELNLWTVSGDFPDGMARAVIHSLQTQGLSRSVLVKVWSSHGQGAPRPIGSYAQLKVRKGGPGIWESGRVGVILNGPDGETAWWTPVSRWAWEDTQRSQGGRGSWRPRTWSHVGVRGPGYPAPLRQYGLHREDGNEPT
jgi:hypothetical protein